MSVNGGISGSPSQVLVLPVRNVLPGLVVSVLLGQTKVNEEEFITVTSDSHQEVVWFDVSVDEVLVVDKLNPTNHLVCQHQDSLHGKPSRTEVEKVFKTGSQQIHDQDIVVSFLSKPVEKK